MTGELVVVDLPNGFRAILCPRRSLPVVASMVWYRTGARDEGRGETGLSHFLEHMMFKGSTRYAKGEIDALTGRLGGSNNAFTDNDSTAYYFAFSADRWETALEIEADRMRGCLLDEAEFQAEKSVVLEELAMGEDDPWSMLFQAAEGLVFQVHPYHHPIIGWREDLERVDVATMRGYYERNYGPNRAFAVCVGDLDVRRTTSRIRELFGSLPAAAPRPPALAEPAATGERRSSIRAPGNLTRIVLARKTCRMGERDDFALDVLAHVLGGGRSSRLHRALVLRDELVSQVSATNQPRLDPGVFWIAMELRPDADPDRVERTVREEIDRLCTEGVTAEELKRARLQIRSAFLFEDETVLESATKIGRFEAAAVDGHALLPRVLSIYDDLDRRALRDAAVRWFGAPEFAVVWSVPVDAPRAKRRRRTTKPATRTRKKAGKAARR